ncbi:hypothetical protein TNCV_4819121 [Trichonephila clavipes]|nr:hypothetical protein TNCV_4819121 [Trichonephila clavipes]
MPLLARCLRSSVPASYAQGCGLDPGRSRKFFRMRKSWTLMSYDNVACRRYLEYEYGSATLGKIKSRQYLASKELD